ncbi:MAG: hypothetical protein IPN77_12835 [Sandaracinaceae bacterium]|nr:hypothetical protein [Sandaracinaceae bacterium]
MTHELPSTSSRARCATPVPLPSLTKRGAFHGPPLILAFALVFLAGCAGEAEPAASTEAVIPADYVGAAGPTPTSACYVAMNDGGLGASCASCLCGRCPTPAQGCGGDARCVAAATCALENDCSGRDCYCGGSVLCSVLPSGPCRDEYRAASGVTGWTRIQRVLSSTDQNNALVRAENLLRCSGGADCATQCSNETAETCFFMNDEACQERYCSVDTAREAAREASAASTATPVIGRVRVNGTSRWTTGSSTPVALAPGDRVVLEGTGFGAGPDVDFAKIMVGNSRVLETDLAMYEQRLNILDGPSAPAQVNYELPETHSTWDRDVVSWTPTRVEFLVPVHVGAAGPIVMQVQKRIGTLESLTLPGVPHSVVDAQTLRITDRDFDFACDVVSELGPVRTSNAVPTRINNPMYADLVARGEEIFWSYDYNIGLAHAFRDLDWTAILDGTVTDPVRGGLADPRVLIGAIPTVRGEVPDAAMDDVYFDPYPMANPIPGFLAVLGQQKREGNTRDTGFVGYRYAESQHPYQGNGEWIGFNCASCHGYRISYQRGAQNITRVIPGLPNPNWSMKWTVLGEFEGVVGSEPGPFWAPGEADIDKTSIAYHMPYGTGEHDLIRGSHEGSSTDNDYMFSPITIPNVTNYMPIRRSLSHTESYVGFEGSYIHSEEPDGAMGSMDAVSLQALTAYMTTLSANDNDLRNAGMSRWLAHKGQRNTLVGANVTEGQFVERGWQTFPALATRVAAGRTTFQTRCASCHSDGMGVNTNERMIRLDEVGRFFTPTIYQRHTQSIRATFLRDLYWVQHRGLLTDGHVRNLPDLVHPDRCTEGTALHNRYYTLHAPTPNLPSAGPDFPADDRPGANPRGDVFRIPRYDGTTAEGRARNLFVERHRYFTTVPWDPTHYYWDYQAMRREYGPTELGTNQPIGMPAAPHPWCAGSAAEVDDLVLYLLTL